MTAESGRRLGGYREDPAPPGMGRFVSAVWAYVAPPGADPPIPGDGHRVLPETDVSLALLTRREADGTVAEAALALIGPVRTPRFYRPAAGEGIEAVRVRAEWARALLGVDPAEHAADVVPAGDLPGLDRPGLLEALVRTTSPRDALRILLDDVADRRAGLESSGRTDVVARGLARIRALGNGSIGDALDGIGLSGRQFRRAVTDLTGLGPKRYQRILRLNRAVARADGRDRPRWARIAVEAGYCDQPHLAQEFRALTGLPPTRLHAERRAQR